MVFIIFDVQNCKHVILKMAATKKTAQQHVKILYVDPDFASYFLMSEFLAGFGISVHHATHGKDAIRMLYEQRIYPLLITEIRVPEKDGFEILRIARSINPRIVAFAQTAYVMKETDQVCLRAGFDAYIPKPVNWKRFGELIRIFLFSSPAFKSH